ncbi:MAG TPA: DUF1648 domain-containing protein [Longimicrobiaceae bacterium]|nr:DUF1648 domain-containing protein [Longimicrobiaceae bacterium]
MKAIHITNGLLVIALLIGSFAAWPHLPANIPVHFGLSGQPDRVVDTSILSWFGLPLVAVATTALTYTVAQWLPSHPNLVNLPDKQQFLALSSARKLPVIARVQDMLYGVSALVLVLFGSIQVMIYRVALGESGEVYILALLVLSFLMTPLMLGIWLPGIQREVNRQRSADETDGTKAANM